MVMLYPGAPDLHAGAETRASSGAGMRAESSPCLLLFLFWFTVREAAAEGLTVLRMAFLG